jgi:acyl-coenzyme A thioesterase PaaI-like protein
MDVRAFQDCYPEDLSHCFGCGSQNEHGHQLKSYWDGDRTVARFMPEPFHTAISGYVYGGLIASLIDCHGTASAAAATAKSKGKELCPDSAVRYVTASIKVDYLAPTPIGEELMLMGKIDELGSRKVIVKVELSADGIACARGHVIAVRMPKEMMSK